MELNELLMKRRSIRSYLEAEVKEEDIKAITEAALLAASWKNTETGRYYVALSEEAKKEVYESLPDFNQNSTKNAAYIIATFKKGLSGCRTQGEYADELKDAWGAYDLGLQNSYLMLKASELGYDTLIMGLRDVDRLRKYFSIPEDEIVMPVIAIGRKAKDGNLRPRKSLDEVLFIK